MQRMILVAALAAPAAAGCRQEPPSPPLHSKATGQEAAPVQRARGVEDPLELVRATYRQYESEGGTPRFPEHAYSDRLRSLIERDRREAEGGVGRLGFDYWIVGQDYRLSGLQIVEEPGATAGRRVIRASFRNMGTPETNRFEFVGAGGRWLIDEIRNERRPGAEGSGWVLSDLLSEPLESTP